MPLICGISDELIALELGTVIARGQPHEVINDPRVVEGYLGGTDEVIFRSGDGKAAAKKKSARKTSAKKRPARRTPLKAAR
jgi:hypothetical protein